MVCVCVCTLACMRACVCMRVCFAHVCVFVCVCLGHISSLPSLSLRIQSSPDGADSYFLRWLTAFHVINNNCSAYVPFPNNFLYCSPTEEDEGNFYFILISFFFKFFYILYLHREISRIKPGAVLRRSMVINTLGDNCLLRMWAIIPLLVK